MAERAARSNPSSSPSMSTTLSSFPRDRAATWNPSSSSAAGTAASSSTSATLSSSPHDRAATSNPSSSSAAGAAATSSTSTTLSSFRHDRPATSGSGNFAASSSTTRGLPSEEAPATATHNRPPGASPSATATSNPPMDKHNCWFSPPLSLKTPPPQKVRRPSVAPAAAPPPMSTNTPQQRPPPSPSPTSSKVNNRTSGKVPYSPYMHIGHARAQGMSLLPLSLKPLLSKDATYQQHLASDSVKLTPEFLKHYELFLRFLKTYVQDQDKTPFFQSQLLAMNESSSYTMLITWCQMFQHGDYDLIVATCNSLDSLEDWLLPALRQFFTEKYFGNEDGRLNKTNLKFSGFPVSMEKLEDYFLTHGPFVQSVGIYGILAPTVTGRRLIKMLVNALADNHKKQVSWEGIYNSSHIVIIDDGLKSECIMILGDTVKASPDAMLADLHTAAQLIRPLYEKDNVFAVYVDDLIQELEKRTPGRVGTEWFMEYLKYHPALMPSCARRCFQTLLPKIYNRYRIGCYDLNIIMKNHAYPYNWKIFVKSPEMGANVVLYKVYTHEKPNENSTDKYGESMAELMRFIRNVLEHAEQTEGQCEHYCLADLELFTAKTFCQFLPYVVRTLLEKRLMDKYFKEAWGNYKTSTEDKTDPWSN